MSSGKPTFTHRPTTGRPDPGGRFELTAAFKRPPGATPYPSRRGEGTASAFVPGSGSGSGSATYPTITLATPTGLTVNGSDTEVLGGPTPSFVFAFTATSELFKGDGLGGMTPAAAGVDYVRSVTGGTNVTLTGTAADPVINAAGGTGAITTDYISGCYLTWASATTITIGTGTYWHPGSATQVDIVAPVTIAPVLAANTLYYVYGNGAGAFAASTTAPANYQGTAWKSAGGDRYVGAFFTNGAAQIVRSVRAAGTVTFETDTHTTPYKVISGGNAIVATSVSLAAFVPTTAAYGLLYFEIQGGGASPISFAFGNANIPPVSGAGPYVLAQSTTSDRVPGVGRPLALASQAFQYITSLGAAATLNAFVYGYTEDR